MSANLSVAQTPAVQSSLFAEPALADPAAPKRRYVKFLGAVIGAGCDLIGLAHRAGREHTTSRSHDASADAAVEKIDRLAYRIAVEAEARGDEATLLLAGRIRGKVRDYRAHDARETHHAGLVASVLDRIVTTARTLNEAITAKLSVLTAGAR